MESSIRRVGIIFSGGPAPAANAVISAAAVSFLEEGVEKFAVFVLVPYSIPGPYEPFASIAHCYVPLRTGFWFLSKPSVDKGSPEISPKRFPRHPSRNPQDNFSQVAKVPPASRRDAADIPNGSPDIS